MKDAFRGMMTLVYELRDTARAEKLFAGWQETLID